MKKYRHKKTGEIGIYKDGVMRVGRFCVEIELNLNYWEEITS